MAFNFASKTILDEKQLSSTADKIAEFRRRRAEAHEPVGPKPLDKVRSTGRLTARERLDYLLDEGSFVETDQLVRHRTHDFGMQAKRPATDGIPGRHRLWWRVG